MIRHSGATTMYFCVSEGRHSFPVSRFRYFVKMMMTTTTTTVTIKKMKMVKNQQFAGNISLTISIVSCNVPFTFAYLIGTLFALAPCLT